MLKKWMMGAFLGMLLGASPVKAATVTISGGSTVCTSYGTVDVGASGNVVINNCTSGGGSSASTNATFSVTAPTTATVNTPITATVTRVVGSGGVAGADTLTLTSTLSGAAFSPSTVSFSAAEGSAAVAKNVNVTFSTAGTGSVSVSGQGTGNTVTASSVITVSSGGTGACAGITPFDIQNSAPYPTLPTSGYGFPAILMNAPSSTEYATAAVAFTVPSTAPSSGYWVLQYSENTTGTLAELYSAISTCPGDMRGAETGGGSSDDIKCRRDPAHITMGVVFSSSETTSYCKLTPGTTYYFNMRSKNKGLTGIGFFLNANTN